MMKNFSKWIILQSEKKIAIWILILLAFFESSVFPIPPDLMLIPMILALREKAWFIAGVCTLASVSGGLAGYALGYYLFESFGEPLIEFYGYNDKLALFEEYYNRWGGWIVAAGGLTPLPYKLVTFSSGALALDPWVFLLSSILGRGLRFYILAALLWHFGPTIQRLFKGHYALVILLVLLALAGTFLAIGVL
ncbi:MAG: cytochrome B [Rhodospirillaceae bacterium]|nr:cytochrome B [Alphaproteobacteria bacterium]MBR72968.1 cytochrome B [Rhodospirillaceae bacterium]|tara:strand:+ start:2969 stop:3547 length:579 start_codon:yes stop_codon:yes gene_type:complete